MANNQGERITAQQKADIRALQQIDRQLRRVIAQRFRALNKQQDAAATQRDQPLTLNRQETRQLPGRQLVRKAVSPQIFDNPRDRQMIADELAGRGFYHSAREMGQWMQRDETHAARDDVAMQRSSAWGTDAVEQGIGIGVVAVSVAELSDMSDELHQIMQDDIRQASTDENVQYERADELQADNMDQFSESVEFAEQAFPDGVEAAIAAEALTENSSDQAEQSAEAVEQADQAEVTEA